MFRSLIRQVAITGVAYGVVSGVGLLLAPFLIATYSLALYGQILIARIFVPNGFLGLFDFGVGETTTRQVASARVDGQWAECAGALSLLSAIALGVGAVTGAAIFAGAGSLAEWFDIADEERAGFVQVLRLTGVLQPLLMLSLVAEGVLKGFERFEILRAVEILAALAYAAAAIYLGLSGWGANWVAAALLGSLMLRLAIVAVAAAVILARQGVRPRAWTRSTGSEVRRWTATMFSAKIAGILQYQVANPLIGLLLNPAAVGLFDTVIRLPRFAKVVFALISSTVLPLASRLRSSNDDAATGRLAYYGILGACTLAWPVAIACAVFSEPILTAWIDRQVAEFWPWQSVMFMITLLAVPISFGGSMAMADRTATRAMVRISALQVTVQLPLALALIGSLQQWAFIVAQAVAVALTFPMQYRVLRKALFVEGRLVSRLGLVLAVSTVLSVSVAALNTPSNLAELALQAGASALVAMVLSAALVIDRRDRAAVVAMIREKLSGPL